MFGKKGREISPDQTQPVGTEASPRPTPWLTKGVYGVWRSKLFSRCGAQSANALFASFITITLGAPAAVLGLIEGLADGLAGLARFAGGT